MEVATAILAIFLIILALLLPDDKEVRKGKEGGRTDGLDD